MEVITYMCVLIKMKTTNRIAEELQCKCEVSDKEVEWLGLMAFKRILTRKQSKYGLVITVLNNLLRQAKFVYVSQKLDCVIQAKLASYLIEYILF